MTDRPLAMADWLEAELYRRRTLQLAGPLDDEVGARLAAALMTMDAEGDEAVEFRLTSPGGSLDAALSLIDTIDLLGVPVRATAVGGLFGPAAFVLALCPVRLASPSALIRLSTSATSHAGAADELVRAAAVEEQRLRGLIDRVTAACGRGVADVDDDVRTRRTFTAPEAVEAGLVDQITDSGRGPEPSAPSV